MASSPRNQKFDDAGWCGDGVFPAGATERRYDRGNGAWVDGNTNWFAVQGYRQLTGKHWLQHQEGPAGHRCWTAEDAELGK